MSDYFQWWLKQRETGKHYCNQVVDPNACCPKAHGDNYCTCWMENDTQVEAERVRIEHDLHFEHVKAMRLFGILPKHELVKDNYARCFLGHGAGPFKEDGICCVCKKKVWY